MTKRETQELKGWVFQRNWEKKSVLGLGLEIRRCRRCGPLVQLTAVIMGSTSLSWAPWSGPRNLKKSPLGAFERERRDQSQCSFYFGQINSNLLTSGTRRIQPFPFRRNSFISTAIASSRSILHHHSNHQAVE